MPGVLDFLASPEFSTRVHNVLATEHVPGMAIALLDHGRIGSAGFGLSHLDPPRNCTPDTLFDIASSSKSMTVGALGVLLAGGQHPTITFQTPVHDILGDDFAMAKKEYTSKITIDDIISHRTGLTGHDLSYFGPTATQPDKPDSAVSIVRNLRNLPIAAPLRSKFYYNNIMYTVASHVVEILSKTPFNTFLESTFFQPLGMNHTSIQPSSAIAKGFAKDIASGYIWRQKEKKYSFGFPPVDAPEGQGAGSIITSANDYIKWVKAIMYKEGPISPKVYQEFVRPRACEEEDAPNTEPCLDKMTYAGGFDLYMYRGHQVVSHAGSVSGFGSFHFFVPSLQLGGVFTGNVANADEAAQKLATGLMDYALDTKQGAKSNKMAMASHESAKRKLASRGIERKDVLEKRASRPPISEEQIKEKRQTKPLHHYIGLYKNAGYQDLQIAIRDERLYIDADDRSFGTLFTFHHVSNNTNYAVHMRSSRRFGSEDLGFVSGQFEFQGECASRLGLVLDDDYGKMIWFDRV